MSEKSNRNFENFRSNNSNTLSEYEYRKNKYGLCTKCEQPKTSAEWCQDCNSKRFQHDFDKWTSGNQYIDKFIQETQLKAGNEIEVLEWIPYNRFRNIKYLSKGGFSTVYKAIWLDGYIVCWGITSWKRYTVSFRHYNNHEIVKEVKSPLNKNEKRGFDVVLKSLNNSSNINDDFLNELKIHFQCVSRSSRISSSAVHIYGITQDPETSNYMMFSVYCKSTLFHGDFHSGNILLNKAINVISDFGLSRPVNKSTNTNEIYGVIPYMAPEVLRGKPYTKAADIYSFGIIMWELTSGILLSITDLMILTFL
uniref:Uncharacterized protein n=1 Tax=Rhizophagus irregularis (strain DAOM 181602 / DAOM 197198 / MUCL 43194) TaxID=747089 RepID=U9TQJ2_RHIID